MPKPVDWPKTYTYALQAANELKLVNPKGKANRLLDLWRTCPDCVPTDTQGEPNYYVIRAAIKDIDARTDVACSCVPYNASAQGLQAEISAIGPYKPAIPYGWGWVKLDFNGNPIYAAQPVCPPPAPVPVCPPPPECPTPPKTSGNGNGWALPLFLLAGLGAIGLALTTRKRRAAA